MKSSKITDVMFETKWNDFNIYKLKLANGQSGSILAKSYEPKVGEDLTYTYDVEKSRFRRVNPEYSNGIAKSSISQRGYDGGGSKQDLIVRQVALKSAVEFSQGRKFKCEQVLEVAEIFNNWVNQKDTKTPEVKAPSPSAAREKVLEQADDLPF